MTTRQSEVLCNISNGSHRPVCLASRMFYTDQSVRCLVWVRQTSLCGLQSLEERREMMSLKFALNCLKNPNFSKLFPKNEQRHDMRKRNSSKFVVKRAKTERLRKSSIPYMQNQLNNDYKKRKADLANLQRDLVKSKRLKNCNDTSSVQVNYVSC